MPNDAANPTGLTLDRCQHDATVRIVHIHGEDGDSLRMREVGMYEGAEVRVVTGGDPVILSLFNCRFALSQKAASRVVVAF